MVSPSHFSLEKWLYIGEPHNTGGSASFLQTASGHFSNPLPAISPNHFRPFLQAGPAALPVPEAPPPAPPGLIPTARLAPIPISISRHAGKLHQRIAKELLVSAGGRLPHDWFATALQDAAWSLGAAPTTTTTWRSSGKLWRNFLDGPAKCNFCNLGSTHCGPAFGISFAL